MLLVILDTILMNQAYIRSIQRCWHVRLNVNEKVSIFKVTLLYDSLLLDMYRAIYSVIDDYDPMSGAE